MRVAWLGNVGNVGFQCVRLLRLNGVDAELYLSTNKLSRMYPGNPEVEYAGASREPFIRYHGRGYLNYLLNRVGLPGVLQRHEHLIGSTSQVVQGQSCWEISALRIHRASRLPFFGMATGADLSEVAFQRTPFARLYREALSKCVHLFLVNTNQFGLVGRLGLPGLSYSFLPFRVDLQRAEYASPPEGDRLVFYSVARLDWTSRRRVSTKGNDIFLRGFALYIRQAPEPNCELWISDWGVDRVETRTLIAGLGIERWVRWIPPGDKAHFYHHLNQCHVAIDQFNLGAVGLAALEAMAAGRPVFARCNRDEVRQAYGTDMPVINCVDEHEVCANLRILSSDVVKVKGREAAEWVAHHHSDERVLGELRGAYERVCGGC